MGHFVDMGKRGEVTVDMGPFVDMGVDMYICISVTSPLFLQRIWVPLSMAILLSLHRCGDI